MLLILFANVLRTLYILFYIVVYLCLYECTFYVDIEHNFPVSYAIIGKMNSY